LGSIFKISEGIALITKLTIFYIWLITSRITVLIAWLILAVVELSRLPLLERIEVRIGIPRGRTLPLEVKLNYL
jgi:hypothetical protein